MRLPASTMSGKHPAQQSCRSLTCFATANPSSLHCRHLDKQDFTVFLQRYCLLSDTKLSEIADDMISKLSQPDKQPETTSDDAMQLQLEALSAHQVCQLEMCRASATACTFTFPLLSFVDIAMLTKPYCTLQHCALSWLSQPLEPAMHRIACSPL